VIAHGGGLVEYVRFAKEFFSVRRRERISVYSAVRNSLGATPRYGDWKMRGGRGRVQILNISWTTGQNKNGQKFKKKWVDSKNKNWGRFW